MKLRLLFQKHISLLLTTVMPVCVLMVGFAVSHVIGETETFNPDNNWCNSFGETSNMLTYCPSYSEGSCTYPILTEEDAWFTAGDADTIYWHRDQYRFFDAECGPGNDTTCSAELRNKALNGEFPNGFWNGYEDKDLRTQYNPDRVYSDADWMKWQGELIDGTYYRCPTYILDGVVYVTCDDYVYHWQTGYLNEYIDDPDDPNDPTRREGRKTGTNYYCIAF